MSSKKLTEQRVLLTGASGTLGYHVLEQLASVPKTKVLALLRPSSRIRKAHEFVQCHSVDFFDEKALDEVIKRFSPTCLIHCAATTTRFDRKHWFDMIRFNVDVSLQLCECVSHVSNCHFVYIGTGLAYRDEGRPLSETDALDTRHPYGASKAAADLLVRAAAAEFGVKLTVLRPFSFTGIADDRERLFPSLLRAASENRAFDLAPGDQIRDYCAAQDIASGIIAAALKETSPSSNLRVFNLGSGRTDTLKFVIEKVVSDLGLKIKLCFGGKSYMPFEPKYLSANISVARQSLGWKPKTDLSYAVWQLAEQHFPDLKLQRPTEFL